MIVFVAVLIFAIGLALRALQRGWFWALVGCFGLFEFGGGLVHAIPALIDAIMAKTLMQPTPQADGWMAVAFVLLLISPLHLRHKAKPPIPPEPGR